MTAVDLAPYRAGSTEPWTVDVLAALIRAKQPKTLLETGTYLGMTTVALAEAMPGDAAFWTVEQDANRFDHPIPALLAANVSRVQADALTFLRGWPGPKFDFVFLDDDHGAVHVAAEIDTLVDWTKSPSEWLVAPRALIAVHDVLGPFHLGAVVAARKGFILDLPLLHKAGGLGLIQVPDYRNG